MGAKKFAWFVCFFMFFYLHRLPLCTHASSVREEGSTLLGALLGDLLARLAANLGLDDDGLALGHLGDEHRVDVGEHTALGDGDTAKELVELLVVADGELDVAGDDAALLVVASSVASKLEDLSSEVLEDGSEVHGGTTTDAGGELALLQKARDTANGELKPGLGALGDGLLARSTTSTLSSSLSLASHFLSFGVGKICDPRRERTKPALRELISDSGLTLRRAFFKTSAPL